MEPPSRCQRDPCYRTDYIKGKELLHTQKKRKPQAPSEAPKSPSISTFHSLQLTEELSLLSIPL